MRRKTGFLVPYLVLFGLRRHFTWGELGVAALVISLLLFWLHTYLKRGDEKILKEVRAKQERYEYEQEKKAAAAKKAPKAKGAYRD